MACEAFEHQIHDFVENQLTAPDRAVIEAHLAECAGCQALARQLRQLDAALSRRVKAPALSADFEVRLRQRIQVGAMRLSDAQRAARKRQLQAEYQADMERLHWWQTDWTGVLNILSFTVLVGLAGWVLWHELLGLTSFLNQYATSAPGPNGLAWLLTGSVLLVLVAAVAIQPGTKRLWRALSLA
jgi:anti-sigma factor RsiW